MVFKKWFKKTSLPEAVEAWIKAQSHPDDALQYLIEKELYLYGVRDLSYVIPRKRNAAYFEALTHQESFDSRYHTNLNMLESIAGIHQSTDHHDHPVKATHNIKHEISIKPPTKTIERVGEIPSAKVTSIDSLKSINKKQQIYNASSSVVVTTPEEMFTDRDIDMTCFDD